MHRHGFKLLSTSLIAINLVIMPSMAWAYIDPNASGFLFQLLFPIITAIGAAFIFLRQKVWEMFKGIAKLWRESILKHKD